MAHTINLRTDKLGYIKLYGICDWKKVILPSNIVVPDFNVCTNTLFSYAFKHSVDRPP